MEYSHMVHTAGSLPILLFGGELKIPPKAKHLRDMPGFVSCLGHP